MQVSLTDFVFRPRVAMRYRKKAAFPRSPVSTVFELIERSAAFRNWLSSATHGMSVDLASCTWLQRSLV